MSGARETARDAAREAVAEAIWDSLCPGIRRTPEDIAAYRGAADAAIAAFEAAKPAGEVVREPFIRGWFTDQHEAALAASPVPSEPVFEPGTIRVCPERDGRCPHGLNCPYTLDRGHCDIDASRAALTRPEPAQDAGVKL